MRTAKTVALGRIYATGSPRLLNADPTGSARLPSTYQKGGAKIFGSYANLKYDYPTLVPGYAYYNAAFDVDIYYVTATNPTIRG